MKRFVVLFCLLITSATSLAADPVTRSVSVTGTGFAIALPDEAHLNISIQIRDTSLESARSEVTEVTRKVLSVTRDLGLPERQVRSTGVNVNPDYHYDNVERRQKLIGYFVSRRIDIHLKDLEKLGSLIERATDAGVNQISPPQLKYSKDRDQHREALAAAAKDAEANAEVLARSLGARLGKVQRITDSQVSTPQPMHQERMMVMSAQSSDSGAASYSTGELRVDARVWVTFELLAD